MIDFRKFLSAVAVMLCASGAWASPAANAPAKTGNRLDEVFRSLQQSTQGQPVDINWTPFLVAVAAIILASVAIKHWKQHRAKPAAKTLHNHRKLLREAARAAGVSNRQLKTIAPLAQSQGLSSPLVAVICPSALKKLAQGVQTTEQQAALKAMARSLLKNDGNGRKGTVEEIKTV